MAEYTDITALWANRKIVKQKLVKSSPASNATTMTNPNVNLKYLRSTNAASICTRRQRRKAQILQKAAHAL